jgi:hypothetical protein
MRTVPSCLLLASLLLGCVLEAIASPPGRVFKLAALSSDNHLVVFNSDAPNTGTTVTISGTDSPLTGIDLRATNQKLYGLSDANTIYVVDPLSGAATRVSKLSSGFRGGMESGFDFNPQSDKLRVVAATGQNLRVTAEVGAVAIDGPLTYALNDVHSGRRPAVTAAGYTNSVPKARNTILYVIDYQRDVLLQQDPPNEGVLTTVGKLGVDCNAAIGFDIATDERRTNHAFMVCKSELYRLDINTGAAQSLGKIGGSFSEYVSLAVLSEP